MMARNPKTPWTPPPLTLVLLLSLAATLAACSSGKKGAEKKPPPHPDNAKMTKVCRAVSAAIKANQKDCAKMGQALQSVIKPKQTLINDFTKHTVSKKSGHKFEAAEGACSESFAPVREAFFACRKDPLVQKSLRDLPALR